MLVVRRLGPMQDKKDGPARLTLVVFWLGILLGATSFPSL
jgi:hypothetical protein